MQVIVLFCTPEKGRVELSEAEDAITKLLANQTGNDMICVCILTHGEWTDHGQSLVFSDLNTRGFFKFIEVDVKLEDLNS